MAIETPTIDDLSAVISHAAAPAFMLGAVAGFLSILVGRSERVMDLVREARSRPGGPASQLVSTLEKRVLILHSGIYFAVLSALCTALLLISAFASAFIGIRHQVGMAILFTAALALLMAALVQLARDVRIAIATLRR